MSSFLKEFERHLRTHVERLRDQEQYRQLEDGQGVDFTSNDYLGLSTHPELRRRLAARLKKTDAPIGAPGARLLRGNTATHRRLEERLARFKGTEDALLFPSGYQANIGVLTTLIGPRDRVLWDQLNHASIIDGLRLSGPKKTVFPHLDVDALRAEAAQPHPRGRTFLVTESYYSMDGDVAPLDTYAELAEEYDLGLIVDDTHATGCFGDARGSGLCEHFGVETAVVAITMTFGKALGLSGACVCAPRGIIEYLVNRCRSFIFTTASAPLLAEAVEIALDLVAEEPERRKQAHHLAARLRSGLRERGFDCLDSQGPIVPVLLGENSRALAVARELQLRGHDVRAIRPPTVPDGTARLRISVHANHTEAEVDRLVEALAERADATPDPTPDLSP